MLVHHCLKLCEKLERTQQITSPLHVVGDTVFTTKVGDLVEDALEGVLLGCDDVGEREGLRDGCDDEGCCEGASVTGRAEGRALVGEVEGPCTGLDEEGPADGREADGANEGVLDGTLDEGE